MFGSLEKVYFSHPLYDYACIFHKIIHLDVSNARNSCKCLFVNVCKLEVHDKLDQVHDDC